jgi:hypothetical protein
MNVRNHGTRLSASTKELMVKWYETKHFWRDAKADEFEKRYLDELQSSVDRAVQVIEQLDKLMEKIQKDCE